eukprot:7510071-Pyramimonas_sp.AAC.1
MANRPISHFHLCLAYPATALYHGRGQHESRLSGDAYVRAVFYSYLHYAYPATVVQHGIARHGSPKSGVHTYRSMPIPP